MSLLFFLKPHYTGSGTSGQVQVYDDRIYDRVVKKTKKKINPALIHPFFAENPEFVSVAEELLLEGFNLDEILLLFMMTER